MPGGVFVDTNVFVYARDSSETEKHVGAIEWLESLWRTRRGRTSFQVLNEYYVTVTGKLTRSLKTEQARDDVRDLLAWQPLRHDANTVADAWHVQDRFGFSWRDSLVVASARISCAEFLLTEDLQHGQRIGSVHVVSPFEVKPDEVL